MVSVFWERILVFSISLIWFLPRFSLSKLEETLGWGEKIGSLTDEMVLLVLGVGFLVVSLVVLVEMGVGSLAVEIGRAHV